MSNDPVHPTVLAGDCRATAVNLTTGVAKGVSTERTGPTLPVIFCAVPAVPALLRGCR